MATRDYKPAKELPIYRDQKEVLRLVIKVMIHTNRDVKHSLGQDLVHLALEQLCLIDEIDGKSGIKAEHIKTFINHHHTTEEIIKLLVNNHWCPEDIYIELMPWMDKVERQAWGWFRKANADLSQSPDTPSGESVQS